ncbi:MAG: MMPL family transporter, partial [Proteobacteria bacterium]|nr:MMPL family transporter [Pseudomonadota bacterium]
MADIRQLAAESGLIEKHDVRIRFTGSVALSHEELQSVMQTNMTAITGALILVSIVLIVGLGSGWLVFTILVTLITGLVLTAGFATLTVGELNLISVAFAVLYIGLGVDFAIHYCLRYRELLREGQASNDALGNTSLGTGNALTICAFTTAIGFYAFIPTDYDGVAELGWISGSGMFISLITTMTFMPALLKALPVRAGNNTGPHPFYLRIFEIPSRYGKQINLLALAAMLISLYLIQDLEFDINTINLQPPQNESVKTFKELLKDPEDAPLTGKVIARDPQDAVNIKQNLQQLDAVDEVVWLEDFVPENQDEKLFIIDEMNLLLGGDFFTTESEEITPQERLQSLININDQLQHYSHIQSPALQSFRASLSAYLEYIRALPATARDRQLVALEHSLLASLPGRLATLRAGLDTQGVEAGDVPAEFVRRWSVDGRYLVKVYPRENLQENSAQYHFVEQIQAVEPRLTGGPVVPVEAGKAVIDAFIQAFL